MVEAVLIYLGGFCTGVVGTVVVFWLMTKSYKIGHKDATKGRHIADK